jgi:flagellar basal body rod protein FlgG
MIEASSAKLLNEIDLLGADRAHAADDGYVPNDPDLASTMTETMSDPKHPLAIVLPQHAYLVVNGTQARAYSRNGDLRFVDGELQTSDGKAVLGSGSGESGESLGALRADSVDVALGRVHDPEISSDGVVAYGRTTVDARNGHVSTQRVVVGKVALASFPAGTRLARVDNFSAAPAAGEQPNLGVPGDARFARLRTHAREISSVDVHRATTRWTEAVAAYYALLDAKANNGAKTAMDLIK